MKKNKKIYLFRHGQTDDNLQDIICGVRNTSLNELGKKQAETTGKMLLNKNIKRIYASYLDRAINTAKIVGNELDIDDIVVIHDLHETDFGDVEGKPRPKNHTPVDANGENDFISDIQYPNGESRHAARKRFSNAVLDICNNDENDVIGIAAHGNVLRQFLINFGFENITKVENCEVIEAEYDDNGLKILSRIL